MKPNAVLDSVKLTGKRILLVSAYVPPYAPFGVVRLPAMAQYWQQAGHDVRIVGSKTSIFPIVDHAPLPLDRIAYVGFGGADEPAPLQAPQKPYKAWIARTLPGLMKQLQYGSMQWRDFTKVPDPFVSWVLPAVAHAKDWCLNWKPDLVYSSGPPHSCHMVAQKLKVIFDCQWIAELRDPWSNNPYMNQIGLVNARNRWVERATLKSADALVALTASEQKKLQSIYAKPVFLVRNGFSDDISRSIKLQPSYGDEIVITHAGSLYDGRRDPRKMLDAIRLLGADSRYFRLKLIGEPGVSEALVSSYQDLRGQIDILPQMPHDQVLKVYGQSDILLLLRWDHPSERNFIAGKLFEYIAARRPILCLGDAQGEAADIIRDNGFGFVAQSTQEAAFALRGFLETKRRIGHVPLLSDEPLYKFTRARQFEQLNGFIDAL